jgi:hypothetical protein
MKKRQIPQSLTDREARDLFARFAAPVFRAAKSRQQQRGAQRLAEMLWLALVTGPDIEATIWEALEKTGLDAEDVQAAKDRYYDEMKPSITPAELRALKARYKVKKKGV